jgi:predicted nucleotide-binding protein
MPGSRKPTPKTSRVFTSAAELRRHIEKLSRRLSEIEDLGKEANIDSKSVDTLREHIINNLRDLYGQDSPEFERYEHMHIWGLPLQIQLGFESPAEEAFRKQRGYRLGLEETAAKLNGIIVQLNEKIEDLDGAFDGLSQNTSRLQSKIKSNKVFIVHGHDSELKTAVARVVEQLGLEAIILHEVPNASETVIEKLEKNAAEVGFAVILLTPDDLGKSVKEEELKGRARQNVILELGFFWGLLKRSNVCCIAKRGVDLPSDLHGVVYVGGDDSSWKYTLANNLKHAGYNDIDLNRIK